MMGKGRALHIRKLDWPSGVFVCTFSWIAVGKAVLRLKWRLPISVDHSDERMQVKISYSRTPTRFLALLVLAAMAILVIPAEAIKWPWQSPAPWPRTSSGPVSPLGHPTIESRLQETQLNPFEGYRFVVFGDQRALADGEWQEMIDHIANLSRHRSRLLFMIDTGDMVNDGRFKDQFRMLREILSPVSHLPYLVSIGNHEVHYNESEDARTNVVQCLENLDPAFSMDRFYYAKQIGPVRFIFLDTNDFVYGDEGKSGGLSSPPPGSRAEAQMKWLIQELASRRPDEKIIVVIHHPFIHSSKKHRRLGRNLWSYNYRGRTLPDILLDGGVDVVLMGHTHTYERFLLERDDERMWVINVSGRPRTELLFRGEGKRRATNIRGKEKKMFAKWGWTGLDGWSITQVEAMTGKSHNQFALISVDEEGELLLEMYFLDDDQPLDLRRDPSVLLK
jgi:hypothetical protein